MSKSRQEWPRSTRLLTAEKVSADSLAAAGFGELTATAGLTWAQLLKRPEVTIEPVLGVMREAVRKGTVARRNLLQR